MPCPRLETVSGLSAPAAPTYRDIGLAGRRVVAEESSHCGLVGQVLEWLQAQAGPPAADGDARKAKEVNAMGMGLFGKLKIDPAANPAVLDTGTWDENSAWSLVNGVDVSYWKSLEGAMQNDGSPPSHPSITAYPGSVAKRDGGVILLIECPDRQTLFLSLGRSGIAEEIGPPLASKSFSDDLSMEVFKTDAETLERFFNNIDSTKSPKALGNTPRLGLGCRMTSAIWPAVWPAMDEGNFATNAIQNSLRELNVLEVLVVGR